MCGFYSKKSFNKGNLGDWEKALETQRNSENEYSSVLWIRPTVEDLVFIKDAVVSRGLKSLISVGCGNGFLEWLIHSATRLEVKGIEVNPGWWRSRYTTVYLPHIYPDEEKFCETLEDYNSAIMFCYFNNGPAFQDYLNKYLGRCLIIIGPKSNRHTDPHPFHPSFERDEWTLKEYKKLGDSEDYIVVYDKEAVTN